ncbi:MAG: DUF362 domain-containing protein [Anaerolineae bacterium]
MATVHYLDARERYTQSKVMARLRTLLDMADLPALFHPGDWVAIKIEVGEDGYLDYLRPPLIRAIVDQVQKLGGDPILIDTTHLNAAAAAMSWDLLETTTRNGFVASAVGKDVILADGYTGNEYELLPVDGEELGGVEVARSIAEAKALIVVSHVTAHPFAGLSGALTSLGIGGSARRGKWRIHSPLQPILMSERCDHCELCVEACLKGAIRPNGGALEVDDELCAGCVYYCTAACPYGALAVDGVAAQRFQKRVVEAASAVHVAALGNLHFFNFLFDIGPYPDYYPFADSPIVPDVGILSSRDPVAVDQAALDFIDRMPGLPRSMAEEANALAPGPGKLRRITGVDPELMLEYAEQFGLGTRQYELVVVR